MGLFCQDCGTELASQYRFCPSCGSKNFSALRPTSTGSIPTTAQPSQYAPSQAVFATGHLAGFWIRGVAFGLDLLLLMLLFVVLVLVAGIIAPQAEEALVGDIFNLLWIFAIWIYFANMESGPHQATFGKRIFALKVCGHDGVRISFGRASGRFFSRILSGLFFGAGYLMAAFTAKKQSLHDKIASTLVVRRGE